MAKKNGKTILFWGAALGLLYYLMKRNKAPELPTLPSDPMPQEVPVPSEGGAA